MPFKRLALPLAAILLLTACDDGEDLDEFAAERNAQRDVAPPGPMTEPTIAKTRPGAADGVAEPDTLTDPAAARCGATKGAVYLGKPFSDEMFESIAHIVPEGGAIRVVYPGDDSAADQMPNRLNLFLDQNGVIRDLRCG
ncbi:MAG: I78 family peptidase inhibitor [Pontixanthobacter sp.]